MLCFTHMISIWLFHCKTFSSGTEIDPNPSQQTQHHTFQLKANLLHSLSTLSYRGRRWHGLTSLYHFSVIAASFPAPRSLQRLLTHFSDSLKPKVATQRGPKLCGPLGLRNAFWLYLFLWEISRSLNLALADPRCAAITLCKAPCNYKHHLLFINGQNENACENNGL